MITTNSINATFSPDRKYRYLWECEVNTWTDTLERCVWIMLNPSTADEKAADPTIKRCAGYSQAWGFGGLVVVNLFAWRATDPAELKVAADPIGPLADEAILKMAIDAPLVICAWGAHGSLYNREAEVVGLLQPHSKRLNLKCFGFTNGGQPKHPLRLPKDAPLEDYPIGR